MYALGFVLANVAHEWVVARVLLHCAWLPCVAVGITFNCNYLGRDGSDEG